MNQSHAQSARLSKLMPAYLVPGLHVISGEGYSILSEQKGGIMEAIGTAGCPSLDFLKQGEAGAFQSSSMPHMDGFDVLLADKPCWDVILPKAAAEQAPWDQFCICCWWASPFGPHSAMVGQSRPRCA